jgi:hypothetical protein
MRRKKSELKKNFWSQLVFEKREYTDQIKPWVSVLSGVLIGVWVLIEIFGLGWVVIRGHD